jgi:pyruvate/2-oxoacid:ferredoxin oxidoreductase alpha subunit
MTFQEGRRERFIEAVLAAKLAVTVLCPFIVIAPGFVVPMRSPDQPVKV